MDTDEVYWVYARRRGRVDPPTERSGKWLVFVKRGEANALWDAIARATTERRLGPSAKCGTAKPNPNSTDQSKTVICVYTPDFNDQEDVMRVRDGLRKLGVTWRIPYKLDSVTMAGRYAVRGDTRVSALWA
jgi:hypothetical protein